MVIKPEGGMLDCFLPLVPEEIREYVEEGEGLCLGAVRDDTAAGILVFTVGDGVDKSCTPVTITNIHWLYTAEGYRHQGVASELMEALLEILNSSPSPILACDIPKGYGYDGAEGFFSSKGFVFGTEDIPVMIVTKEDCRKQIRKADKEKALSLAEMPQKPKGMSNLSEITGIRFKKAMRIMLSDEEFDYYRELSEDKNMYDADTSFAVMRGDEISSMVLFRRTRSDELHMVMLDALSDADPKEMLSLLHYSAGRYYLYEPEYMTVRLTLWKQKSLNLAKHIFPGKETLPLRRGYRK